MFSSETKSAVIPFSTLLDGDADGSLAHPYSSIQQVLGHIERNYHQDIAATRRTTINLYPTHHFVSTLRFDQAHSHTRLAMMSAEIRIGFAYLGTFCSIEIISNFERMTKHFVLHQMDCIGIIPDQFL
jgi:hypothetical protein